MIENDTRSLLLTAKTINITVPIGDSDTISSMKLEVFYEIQKKWLLRAHLNPIIANIPSKYTTSVNISRIFVMLNAAFLMILQFRDVINAYAVNRKITKNQYWPIGIIVMSFLIMLSKSWSALMSFLLLIPVLEKSGNPYLFSFSLRYALPIILSLWSNVIIFLCGIILYSILAYPSVMFESFYRSIFSYIYNNFQYATYQIFVQIADHGLVAYAIYLALYFYMVLVAHSLIPSVFCALVQMRNIEKNIKLRLNTLDTYCPVCGDHS